MVVAKEGSCAQGDYSYDIPVNVIMYYEMRKEGLPFNGIRKRVCFKGCFINTQCILCPLMCTHFW